MWAGLYGELTLARGPEAPSADADVYKLFVARSIAMGWLVDAARPRDAGLWGMNDASLAEPSSSSHGPAAWFQVVISDSAIAHAVLPTQPFLACVESVVAAHGVLDLRAVEMVLPPQRRSSRGRNPISLLAQAAGWYPAGTGTAVDISVEAAGSMSGHQPDVLRIVNSLPDSPFVCRSSSLSPLEGPPSAHGLEAWWGAPPTVRLVLRGTIAAWSLDAIGWTAGLVAHACHESGVTTPIRLAATPA